MTKMTRFLCALALLVTNGGVGALAAAPSVEGTPTPIAAKPDFSTMSFLLGTWNCVDVSSRRPGPFNTTEVYSMDPSGYWMLKETTIHKASWIPRELRTETKYTYDPVAKRWVRILTSDRGGYAIATASNPVGNKKTYTTVIQARTSDIISYEPEVFIKVSNTKKTMTSAFTEVSGRVVSVKETCTKT